MTLHQIDDPTSTRIKDLLPFQVKDAEETTKYLGFHLKENNYFYGSLKRLKKGSIFGVTSGYPRKSDSC